MRDEHDDRTVIERIDPLLGVVLDQRYRIDFRIAAGGFGAIYRATHVKSGHQVALKVLHADLATSDERVIARFRREGATLAQLRNPHTITAYELGEAPEGELYIVMELLDGESLFEQFRAHGPLAWERVAAIARMVCSSLAEAHALGVVHRDLKPANIHLENRDGNPDFVKVLDFGIAKIMRDSELDSTELTQAGQMIGTFDYMAPEQMVGGHTTARTDIYTLGIVMYEMICGRRPFADAQSPTSMLASLLTQTPPSLATQARIPAAFERIIMRCLEREPQNRYAEVGELAAELDQLAMAGEGVTRQLSATPPPERSDEPTMIERRSPERPKRDSSQPYIIRREGSGPVPISGKRDNSQPHVVARREGSQPVIGIDKNRDSVESRSKRDTPSPHLLRRDGAHPPFDPRAARPASSLDPVAGDPRARDSQPVSVIDPRARDAQPVPVIDPRARDAQPVPVIDPRARDAQPAPVIDPRARDAQPVPIVGPRTQTAFDPQYRPQAPYDPHANALVPPIPQPPPHGHPSPYTHGAGSQLPPVMDARGSQPMLDGAAWRPPPMYSPPAGGSFDMSGAHTRDIVVRRVVWTLAIVLGVILVIVVLSRM